MFKNGNMFKNSNMFKNNNMLKIFTDLIYWRLFQVLSTQ